MNIQIIYLLIFHFFLSVTEVLLYKRENFKDSTSGGVALVRTISRCYSEGVTFTVGFAPYESFKPVLVLRDSRQGVEITFMCVHDFTYTMQCIETIDHGKFERRFEYNPSVKVTFGKCPLNNPEGDFIFKQKFDKQLERVLIVKKTDIVSLIKNDFQSFEYFSDLCFLRVCYFNTAQAIFSALKEEMDVHFINNGNENKNDKDYLCFLLHKIGNEVFDRGLLVRRHKDELSFNEVCLFAREFLSLCKPLIIYCYLRDYFHLNSAFHD